MQEKTQCSADHAKFGALSESGALEGLGWVHRKARGLSGLSRASCPRGLATRAFLVLLSMTRIGAGFDADGIGRKRGDAFGWQN
jgi:hypothetical protein